MNKRRIVKYLFILILLLFSIEFLGMGSITVYRIAIFPLSLLLMMVTFSMPRLPSASVLNLLWTLYFLWFSLCQVLTDDNPLFPIFTIPLAYALTNFVLLKDEIKVDYASVFVWYLFPHLVALLTGSYMMEIGGRFCGAHKDANFCAQLLSVSFLSSLFLLRRKDLSKIHLIVYITIAIIDAVLIFMTGSRGSIFSIAMVVVIMFLQVKMKIGLKASIILIGLISLLYLWNHIQKLPDFVSPEESIVDSILCRFKPDSMEGGSGRFELWSTAVERMIDGNHYFSPLGHIAATRGAINKFTHNTILDFLVENGIVVGIIMVFILMGTVMNLLRKIRKKGLDIQDIDFAYIYICSIAQFFFISAISEKIVWLFIIGAIAIKNKHKKPHMGSLPQWNRKTIGAYN